MRMGSGAYEGPYTYASRFEEGPDKPEELVGAGACRLFLDVLSGLLTKAGITPTTSRRHPRHLGAGPAITDIELDTRKRQGLDNAKLQELAAEAKAGCPISKALAGVGNIKLTATLE